MEKEYSESFFLSAGEVNAEGEMSLPILTSKIIDIATAHANSLHIGNPDMQYLGAGWVLSRLSIEMDSWPRTNDSYTVTTWVEGWNRHFSVRDFCFSSPEGKIYGYARSVWMVMTTDTHENYGLSHLSFPPEFISDRACPVPRQAKHHPILRADAEGTDGQSRATEPPAFYRFKYCDIDYYRHVNTVRYVSLLLNQFPLEFHDNNILRRFELNFLHEASYGMTVEILRCDSDGDTAITLSREGSVQPLLYSRLKFRPRS